MCPDGSHGLPRVSGARVFNASLCVLSAGCADYVDCGYQGDELGARTRSNGSDASPVSSSISTLDDLTVQARPLFVRPKHFSILSLSVDET
jgi:hypothetical protein